MGECGQEISVIWCSISGISESELTSFRSGVAHGKVQRFVAFSWQRSPGKQRDPIESYYIGYKSWSNGTLEHGERSCPIYEQW